VPLLVPVLVPVRAGRRGHGDQLCALGFEQGDGVAARYCLHGPGDIERTRSRAEDRRADRYGGDRYGGENRDREDNADTPDQAPLAPIAAIPRPVSRQGCPFFRPFLRPCPA